MKYMHVIGLSVFCAVGLSVIQAFGQEEEGNHEEPRIQKLRGVLQENCVRFPSVTANTDLSTVFFQEVDLSTAVVTVDGRSYCAFRFKTPDRAAELVWGFQYVQGLIEWYIVPAQGRMSGFTTFANKYLQKDIEGLGPHRARFILQTLNARNLKPETEYIMWFGIASDAGPTIKYSLNLLDGERLSYKDVFPVFYETPPSEP